MPAAGDAWTAPMRRASSHVTSSSREEPHTSIWRKHRRHQHRPFIGGASQHRHFDRQSATARMLWA